MYNNKIKEKLKNLPLLPGVYIMKNADNDVIYVGKSKHLKNRVSQYFMNLKSHTSKTSAMVSHIDDFDYIITDSETEALILECNLIKKHRPRYNILLKDDKQYPYIKITENEDFPRIFITRKVLRDGGRYFGPYMSSIMVKNALETIKKVFKIRSCTGKLKVSALKNRPCLYYHIGQCSAPCCGKIGQEEYKDLFNEISAVLEGKYDELSESLAKDMHEASDNLEFEKAARIRDKINSISILGEKQKIVSTKNDNRDIIGAFKNDDGICVQIFYMRDGKLQGSEYFVFNEAESEISEVLSEFVKQYYYNATNVPREILLSSEFEDMATIEKWLKEKTGHKISVTVPKKGEKFRLIQMVTKNAEESLLQYMFKRNRDDMEQNKILKELAAFLKLDNTPFVIEMYDISNISGKESVGAMITYKNATPQKKKYRIFNIKTVEGADDYESMREVIARRVNKAYEEEEKIKNGLLDPEKSKFLPLPDLILLDGGKGHVSAVNTLMETLGEDIPLFGLAKDDKHKTGTVTNEKEEFYLDKRNTLFKFLSEMQEEVHRFAITSFRKRHTNASIASELEKIYGVGHEKRKKLLNYFLSIEKIKEADIEELKKVVDRKTAENVYKHFNGGANDEQADK